MSGCGVPEIASRLSMAIDELHDLQLPDSSGHLHRLGERWSQSPHVLLFLRHFG